MADLSTEPSKWFFQGAAIKLLVCISLMVAVIFRGQLTSELFWGLIAAAVIGGAFQVIGLTKAYRQRMQKLKEDYERDREKLGL